MARKKKDVKVSSAILKTYAAGASLADLKAKYGISGKGQLASAVLDALIASGKMPQISRGRSPKAVPAEFTVAINRRGTIVLPKEAVIESFRFTEGQSFNAKRRGKKVILTLAG